MLELAQVERGTGCFVASRLWARAVSWFGHACGIKVQAKLVGVCELVGLEFVVLEYKRSCLVCVKRSVLLSQGGRLKVEECERNRGGTGDWRRELDEGGGRRKAEDSSWVTVTGCDLARFNSYSRLVAHHFS